MLFTLTPSCSNLSNMPQDILPPLSQSSSPYCTALQFAVDILQYQNRKLGAEKRFIAFQLLFHKKIEQLHLYLYLGVRDSLFLLHVTCLPCVAIKNPLSKKPEFFLGAHSQQNENINTANGFAKSSFLSEPNWILFFLNKESNNPYLSSLLHTGPNLPHKHTTSLLLLTLFGKAVLHKLFSDWDIAYTIFPEINPCASHQQ